MKEYDVIIVGGGITGAGVARDCALRGLSVLLLERNDIATGATGRNHGLMHSGARYVVDDPESAAECMRENQILRKIAFHCTENNKCLFVTLPEDDQAGYGLDYQKTFVKACRKAGISAERLSPKEAVRLEPSVNANLLGAVLVPDTSVDPFRLCSSNVLDAKLHGAEFLNYTEVVSLIVEGDSVTGVRVKNAVDGECEIRSKVVVNAAGLWGFNLLSDQGIKLNMYPAKGTLIVFGERVNKAVLHRCRKPYDGDILVPGGPVTILGTTSTKVTLSQSDKVLPTRSEVEFLLREGYRMCPSLTSTRILRAYSGVRPLVTEQDDPTGRGVSRGIVCLDHETRDGIKGLITITGGKLTTYRLMAEVATDLVCEKLKLKLKCQTASRPLPGSEKKVSAKDYWDDPTSGQSASAARQGTRARDIYQSEDDKRIICGCEKVTVGEIKYAVRELGVTNLGDLRRRVHIGMGPCQGTYCIYKAAEIIAEALGTPGKAKDMARKYLTERWKGMCCVGWGENIRDMEIMQRTYKEELSDED